MASANNKLARERAVLDAIDELADDDPMTEVEARAVTEQIRSGMTNVWALVEKAYKRRAWVALGYPSWDVYASRELDTQHMRIPREDRAEVLTSLRKAGLSYRAIADVTNVGSSTVHREAGDASVPDGTVVGLDNRRRNARRPSDRAMAHPEQPVPAELDDIDRLVNHQLGQAGRRGEHYPAARDPLMPNRPPTPRPTPPQPPVQPLSRAEVRAARAAARRRQAIEVLNRKSPEPIGVDLVCTLIGRMAEPTDDMARAIADALTTKWGSWTAFRTAARSGEAE